MAKRFTATEKWDDPWFDSLSNTNKLFWIYLLDKCNHAGIWQVNWRLVKHHIGTDKIDLKDFKDRILVLSNEKWHIPKFIEFQYGVLNKDNRAHASVLILLEKEGASKGLARGLLAPKDKDKDMDMDTNNTDMDTKRVDTNAIVSIISDLNDVLKTSYKATSDKTKELIRARLKDGFTIDDFKTVHRKMLKAWGFDNKMRQYLRPITLYSNKFEGYLNQQEANNYGERDQTERRKQLDGLGTEI